jgi:hypothetical protein
MKLGLDDLDASLALEIEKRERERVQLHAAFARRSATLSAVARSHSASKPPSPPL